MVSAWPEPPNAKSAGARCGVQGTFAEGGFIETPHRTRTGSNVRRFGEGNKIGATALWL